MAENSNVTVQKRDGSSQQLDVGKITRRIERLCDGMNRTYVDVPMMVETILRGIPESTTSKKLDELIAQTAAYSVVRHPDYSLLGGRLSVTALHKKTSPSVLETFRLLHDNVCAATGRKSALISEEVWSVVQQRHEELQHLIDYARDLQYEYFGYKTLERSYLLRIERSRGELDIVERPQHMLLRVALGIHLDDMSRVRETYELMSRGMFTHASPTLFNAGMPSAQMSSCFLVAMRDDSIEGIYDTLKQCACISKAAGGIGLHVHNIRSSGSYIGGTNGTSNGLVPMLRVFNNTARYVDQGGGKRKGAFAVYLEPWHGDVFDFLLLRRNTGKEDYRARDLFYGMWICDLFMKRVERNEKWTLFDPHTAPGLSDTFGEQFEALYTRYETEGLGVRTVQAQELWFTILESQMETGTPYLVYKDACNSKSNQQNLGTIKCSNLCTEIVEYTDPNEVAVCNLASIALPRFVDTEKGVFDHQRLFDVTKVATFNLNRVVDVNYYPIEEARRSNMRHRPIGLGVQGLADAFLLMQYPFSSPQAQELNEQIFETIYFAAVTMSAELAEQKGPYETFAGSPASKGLLQFDLWGKQPTSGRWDWAGLKAKVQRTGIYNSLMVAPMPTASTSQILGNNECFEPFTSNIYLRRVLSGEFPVVNKYLVLELIKRNLWNEDIRNQIIGHNGSIQKVAGIPQDVKELYKIVWEIRQKDIIDMAAARGKYIDQSQSLNLFIESPKASQLTSMHFYAWKQGLKTGCYYLRTRPAVDAIKFTVDAKKLREVDANKMSNTNTAEKQQDDKENIMSPVSNNEGGECLSCGS